VIGIAACLMFGQPAPAAGAERFAAVPKLPGTG
jgi:hypothetical protein